LTARTYRSSISRSPRSTKAVTWEPRDCVGDKAPPWHLDHLGGDQVVYFAVWHGAAGEN
jgi:hypothetical protein